MLIKFTFYLQFSLISSHINLQFSCKPAFVIPKGSIMSIIDPFGMTKNEQKQLKDKGSIVLKTITLN